MVSRGDVNVLLNRLIREGVIGGFKTNFDGPSVAQGLQVVVTAGEAAEQGASRPDPKRVEALRNRVSRELKKLDAEATVTVEGNP